MKITIEITPEEAKEMVSLDKIIEMQQEIAKEMVKQTMSKFNSFEDNGKFLREYFNIWTTGGKSD